MTFATSVALKPSAPGYLAPTRVPIGSGTKIGDRVCLNGNETDQGKITATQFRYVTIKWNDGHQSFTGHNHMARIERVK